MSIKQEAKFYTRTPNILFESYQDLHPQEKWLFINLVYLCGKEGTRHLSLRYISDRTGISIGALSGSKDPKKDNPGMIRNLHNAGLIHAEIKRKVARNGKQSDQAQYHITITDIWQLNLDFFTKCSDYEQERSENEQPHNTGVQKMNTSVQNMNSSDKERSENERERSDSDTNIRLQDKITDRNKTTKQEDSITSANAESDSHASLIDFAERKTDKHKAVSLHVATDYEKEDTERVIRPTLTIGAKHARTDHSDYSHSRDDSNDPDVRTHESIGPGEQVGRADSQGHAPQEQQSELEQPPEVPPVPSSLTYQAATGAPAAGTTDSPPPHVVPEQRGAGSDRKIIPKRPRHLKPAVAPPFLLTEQQQAFWSLWCGVWFNKDIPPAMTETAYRHVVELAPFVTTAEQLNSLIDYTKADLQESAGIKRKAVQLGNCVNCYSGWKQAQPIPIDTQKKDKNIGVSGLPILKTMEELYG